jgi:hypothetical protein
MYACTNLVEVEGLDLEEVEDLGEGQRDERRRLEHHLQAARQQRAVERLLKTTNVSVSHTNKRVFRVRGGTPPGRHDAKANHTCLISFTYKQAVSQSAMIGPSRDDSKNGCVHPPLSKGTIKILLPSAPPTGAKASCIPYAEVCATSPTCASSSACLLVPRRSDSLSRIACNTHTPHALRPHRGPAHFHLNRSCEPYALQLGIELKHQILISQG